MDYVIIGNSTAAIGAIEGIRSIDKSSGITVISNEAHHTYSRPLISYLLQGKTTTEKMKYRNDSFYEDNNCITLFGKTVIKIDDKEKTVFLDDGKSVKYDKLLFATGSSPFTPPFEGLNTVKNRFTFMKLDDALTLDTAISDKSRVLIIGAGLIGLKCAEGILERVSSVTVCDLCERILSSILDEESAEIVTQHLVKSGIKLVLGNSVARFEGNKAFFQNGDVLEFDILVTAVGVRANTALLKDIGAQTERGIITDLHMKTSLDDIYAAGDCSESFDISYGGRRVLAILPNAYRQGECAGMNMAGEEKTFDCSIPMNSIGFLGLHVITAGTYTGDVYRSAKDGCIKKLFYSDNLLKGFILVGNVDKAGIYTSLIREKVPLDTIDFELICEQPQLMAFSKKYRNEKLGGIK